MKLFYAKNHFLFLLQFHSIKLKAIFLTETEFDVDIVLFLLRMTDTLLYKSNQLLLSF